MGRVLSIIDRLTNVMSGMGTTVDRRAGARYVFSLMTPQEAEAAYRSGSWLVRKIIDIPPLDMTRAWRDWQAEKDAIEKLEKEERRLQLKAKCKRALILSRLYGGGALVLGTDDGDPMKPLRPEAVRTGGLAYIHVMAPQQLGMGRMIGDIASPWYGEPEYFEIVSARNSRVRLHPSRLATLKGQRAPEGSFYANQSWYWGDPIMQSIGEAVKNADTAQGGFASLIDEAKLDILKMPDLTNIVGTADGEAKILARLQAAAIGKSTWRALILDKEDEWDHRQITWAGIPEILRQYLEIVAGAADIPVTRLLGQSPKGLQSTGEGEERDYHAMVAARQDELLSPALDRIDEVLIPSALGSRPDDIYYEFAPLQELSEKEAAEIESKYAATFKTYADTGLVSDEALGKAAINGMIERGQFPGLEAAIEEAGNDGLPEEDEGGDDELLLTAAEAAAAKAETLRKQGAVTEDQATMLIADARPRSLYVSRKLLNAADLIKWAKAQGFETTLPTGDMHVTVLFSKAHVDWLKMGSAWEQDQKGQLTVPAGGARIVEPLGDKGAIVLLFNSSALSWRHEDMVRKGASHDWDEYQPHVTISYNRTDGLDLDEVEPYRGKLVFGPEIFAEIDDDWTKKLTEDGGGRKAGGPFDDAGYRPEQPRDRFGKWTSMAALNFVANAKGDIRLKSLQLGTVPEHVHARLERMGIKRRERSVNLDQDRVRHILREHGPGSGDRNPVDAVDIANVHRMLGVATLSKGTPFKVKEGFRVHFKATLAGHAYAGAFEVRRNTIVPQTLYRSGKR